MTRVSWVWSVRAWGPSTGPTPCGGGGRASPGGVPSTVVRGVWGQALPLPRLPTLWAGRRGSLATCCGRGCVCVRCVWCLCGVCRGAWCCFSLVPLVLPSPVLRCGVVPAVCRVPAVPPSLRASVARLLATPCFVRGFGALFPFLCSPFSLACTFSLPPPWCVSLSFSLPAFSLVAPCETKERVGVCGPSSCIVGTTFVAASQRITYLPSHLCPRVCARSSPFVPYHGVLMSLFPYPHPIVCCLLWCRCTPYAKTDVRGWGPSFLFLCLLPGWFHTFVGLGWWRGPGARCFSRVRGVAGHGNILAWLPPFPPHLSTNTTLTHDTTRGIACTTYTNSIASSPHHLLHTLPDRATETSHRPPLNTGR